MNTKNKALTLTDLQAEKNRKWDNFLMYVGVWLRDHQSAVLGIQWTIVLIYAVLLIVPLFVPLPGNFDHILTHITVFAQFIFWGIWWPFVLLSMILFGRLWCGVMCPEGALSEWSAKHGMGKPIPKWMRWAGWPFLAFTITTIDGQLVSVYQYPYAVILVLGGSTIAAMAIGFIYTKGKRAWCRYLCPVTGVFALLSKIAPMHYQVDKEAWDLDARERKAKTIPIHAVNCAPLQPLKTMAGNSGCHMCGRCSGYHNAIYLKSRSPSEEIITVAGKEANKWQTLLIVFGLLGIAIGAFHWTVSPYFIDIKMWGAEWLVDHDIMWPLSDNAPWFLLTNYPENNDVFTWLDGATILAYILLTALILGSLLMICLNLSVYFTGLWTRQKVNHLAQALIPLAGLGVFLGLSATTLNLLKYDGVPTHWGNPLRLCLLCLTSIYCAYLAYRILRTWVSTHKSILALIPFLLCIALINIAWGLMFWWW